MKQIEMLLYECEKFYPRIEKDKILTRDKKAPYPEIRAAIITAYSRRYRLTRSKAGKIFNRDHSTISYLSQKVEDLCYVDKRYKRFYNHLRNKLKQ